MESRKRTWKKTRSVPGYRPMPIVFNEDDHEGFDQPVNNCAAAIAGHASWGWFDYRRPSDYVPVGHTFTGRMDKITGPKVKAWWFNPRDGKATAIGTFENKGEQAFTPPPPSELLDWVLVLDDAVKGYPQPGTGAFKR